MRAVVAHALGPPETLAIEERPPCAPGPGELRVGVHFAGVSFVDVLIAAGGYQLKPLTPFVPGTEFSGVVLEMGEGVRGFSPGDKVRAASFGGAFAEEAVVSAAAATIVASNLDMAQAAVIGSSYLTACYALKWRARVRPGETVLVLGAGGAVGIAAVQVARAYGAVPIASASSEAKRRLALANGATHVLDSAAADWRDQIKALTDGRGVDVVVDSLGGMHTERAFRSLAWNGRHLVIGFAAGDIPKLPTNLALVKGAALLGVDLRQFGIQQPEESAKVAQEVLRLVMEGVARPPIAQIYPFTDYVSAMQAAATGAAAGRILLEMPLAAAG